ncbi:MAG: hypothetical protein KC931_18325, partial [Candidatus Omnitrophica bacterium]|nr:hypothetical protein [Candidatus Omnitrophota bacterium]
MPEIESWRSSLLSTLFLLLLLQGYAAVAESPLRDPTVIQLGVENVGTTVIGHLGAETLFLTQGYVQVDNEKFPALECRNSLGRLKWKIRGEKPDYYCGEYLQWIEPTDSEPLVLWTYFPNPQGGEGLHNEGGLYRVRDGFQVHQFPKASNNASFPIETPDGSVDLIFSGQQFIQRIDLRTFEPKWEYNDRVQFCWGYPTLVPRLNGEAPGIVWGSEYNLPDGKSSSAVAIDLEGKEIWKFDGVQEDIGSTPFFPVDVDSDGSLELVKNGLDLCGKNQLPSNHLFVFSTGGKLLRQIPSMMYSNGLADLDRDGHIEAFGVVCHRDGGREALKRKEIRCVDLVTGDLKWTVPVPRVGLPAANALAADVNG